MPGSKAIIKATKTCVSVIVIKLHKYHLYGLNPNFGKPRRFYHRIVTKLNIKPSQSAGGSILFTLHGRSTRYSQIQAE